MRTTIDLDQALLRLARKRALESHRTLSQVMEEAMRRLLREPAKTARKPFRLIAAGESGTVAPTWDEIKRQVNDEDDVRARRVADAPNKDDRAAP
jgi:urocanate hydratase